MADNGPPWSGLEGEGEKQRRRGGSSPVVLRRGELGGCRGREGLTHKVTTHLDVPKMWREVVGQGRHARLQRLQRAELIGEEDAGVVRSLRWL